MTFQDTLFAFLSDTYVGRFYRSSRGTVSFAYDDDYRWSANPTPLSLDMPLEEESFDDERPAIFLEALIPESPAARANAARLHHAASTGAFDLLTAIGLDSTGALRLTTTPQPPNELYDLIPLDDAAIALRLRQAAPTGEHSSDEDEHWSVAGQQGKTALLLQNGQWFAASGNALTTHILKPGIPSLPDQAFDEHFTMRIAHFLGLRVAETEFRFFDGEPAIVSTRFDRIQNADGTVRALHQIDFTQALGVGADQKYEEHGGPRSEAYAEMLRAHDIHHEADSNVRIFADGMLASYLLGATDSHAKNYSLMLQDSHVAMAPIYDFASVFPYLASGTQRYASTLAMTIGGQRKLLQLREKHLLRFADRMKLPREYVINRFTGLVKTLPDAFDQATEENRQTFALLKDKNFLEHFQQRLAMTIDDAKTWINM